MDWVNGGNVLSAWELGMRWLPMESRRQAVCNSVSKFHTTSQRFPFLGLELDSLMHHKFLRRVSGFRLCLAKFCLGHTVRFCQCLRLLGMMMVSVMEVVPVGLLLMHAFQS
jgi:hypothetical protein